MGVWLVPMVGWFPAPPLVGSLLLIKNSWCCAVSLFWKIWSVRPFVHGSPARSNRSPCCFAAVTSRMKKKTVLHQSHDLQFQKSDSLFISEEHFKSFFLSYVNPIKRPSPLSSLSLNFFAMQIFRPKQKKRGEKRRFFFKKKPSWKEKRSNIAAGWPQQRTYGLFFLFFAPRYDPLTCQKNSPCQFALAPEIRVQLYG